MKNLILFLSALLVTGMVYGQTRVTTYGDQAGFRGTNNSFFGYYAGNGATGNNEHCTFVGANAGRKTVNGDHNVFLGSNCGYENTKGKQNLFVGSSTGRYNTLGSYNTFFGRSAGYRNTVGNSNTFLGVNAGYSNINGSNNLCIGYNAGYNETGSNKLHIANNQNNSLIYGDFTDEYIGIAIDPSDVVNPSEYALYLGKGILSTKVKVAFKPTPGNPNPNWSDYVFEADYKRNSLEQVDDFVKKNKHLPNVPSAAEVYKNGIDVAEMDATLLRQIEELWLHMIDMKKENDSLKEAIKNLEEQKK